jgi:hypothetical protein
MVEFIQKFWCLLYILIALSGTTPNLVEPRRFGAKMI